jgi:hypothetical protein
VSVFGIYVMVLLLAGTFPVGAGDALHGGALLHPAIPHVHTYSANAEPSPQPQAHGPTGKLEVGMKPAIEASPGGATEAPVTAITPPLPRVTQVPLLGQEQRLLGRELPRPLARLEPPPDPPPTSLALA